jgi:hypothetical protein
MGWFGLKGSIKTIAGTGAFSTPFASGTRILQIKFVGGTCTVPSGDGSTTQVITGVAGQWFDMTEHHAVRILQGTGTQLEIQMSAGVTSWFIEYIGPAGNS